MRGKAGAAVVFAGLSGLTVIPEGFSLDVWMVLLQHPLVQSGILNSIVVALAPSTQ